MENVARSHNIHLGKLPEYLDVRCWRWFNIVTPKISPRSIAAINPWTSLIYIHIPLTLNVSSLQDILLNQMVLRCIYLFPRVTKWSLHEAPWSLWPRVFVSKLLYFMCPAAFCIYSNHSRGHTFTILRCNQEFSLTKILKSSIYNHSNISKTPKLHFF